MKRIGIKKMRDELIKLKADSSTIDLVMNHISLYNDLVVAYKKDPTKNVYILYQLNTQIVKQISALKINLSKGVTDNEGDELDNFIKNIKEKSIEKR